MEALKAAGRRIGLNTAYRQLFTYPKSVIRQSILEGGPLEQRKTARGQAEMIEAARRLPPLQRHDGRPTREVWFMTGRKYWYQTAFCFKTLHETSPVDYVPVLLDDGTIDAEVRAEIVRVVPWARFYLQDEILDDLATLVPEAKYPLIRHWRIRQPLTRKLTDLHGGKSGWKMLLDSDMLFFRTPDWLTAWMLEPNRPAYMVDCWEAYGYSAELRTKIAGTDAFPDRANIGIFGFHSEDLDLDWLEYAFGALVGAEGTRYNITQGMTSMLFAGRDCAVAPERDYIVLPSVAEGRAPTAVMHHYVAQSKRLYFQYGWQRTVADIATGDAV